LGIFAVSLGNVICFAIASAMNISYGLKIIKIK
jgi:hypothetical protein